MKKRRLIPVLLLRNGWLVQSKGFSRYQNLGNPFTAVKRLSEWASDELIYLDISRDDQYDMRRDDIRHPNRGSFLEIIQDVAQVSFMPITVGGRIRTLADVATRLSLGADKIAINTQPLLEPSFIGSVAREFGSQCVVVAVDARLVDGRYVVHSHWGTTPTAWHPVEWARRAEAEGAGEILINSIDRDGLRNGYDLELLGGVADAVRIPVIGLGGVGEWEHLAQGLAQTALDAVAAANIFHYMDQSVYLAKKFLFERGLDVRPPDLLTV